MRKLLLTIALIAGFSVSAQRNARIYKSPSYEPGNGIVIKNSTGGWVSEVIKNELIFSGINIISDVTSGVEKQVDKDGALLDEGTITSKYVIKHKAKYYFLINAYNPFRGEITDLNTGEIVFRFQAKSPGNRRKIAAFAKEIAVMLK